jgi:hypothetical protein
MNKIKYIIAAAVLGLFLGATTQAREEKVIQFTTLPQVVRTTVFHHYNITAPEKVVRVVELADNIYEITVVTDSGQQVVFVNAEGNIVERPSGVVETTGGSSSAEVTVTLDEVQSAGERYEFVQDQGPDAIFIDHQTNKRVIVKGGAGKGPRGGVRTKEESQTDERTTEKNRTNVQINEQNKGGVRTDEKNEQPGNMREKSDQGNADRDQKTLRQDERDQNRGTQTEQKEQGTREAPGNTQEDRNAGRQDKNTEQKKMNPEQGQKQQRDTNRTPGQEQQKTQEREKGKTKASPTP